MAKKKYKVTMEGSNLVLRGRERSFGFHCQLLIEAEDGQSAAEIAVSRCIEDARRNKFWSDQDIVVSEPLIYVAGVDEAKPDFQESRLSWFEEVVE